MATKAKAESVEDDELAALGLDPVEIEAWATDVVLPVLLSATTVSAYASSRAIADMYLHDVVEFREKLDVRNPIGVDEDRGLEDVVSLPLVPVVLEMEVVSVPELVVFGAEVGLLGALLVLGAELVSFVVSLVLEAVVDSFCPLGLDIEETSLGASTPETSLRSPGTAETGNPVAASESETDNDKARSGEVVVGMLCVELTPVLLESGNGEGVADDIAVPWRGDNL